MADNKTNPAMKWRVVMANYPHERLDWEYYERHILGEYATEEEAIEAAKEKMVQMGQFQGWANDDDDDGYYHGGPPYSTTDDPDGALDEDEHTDIYVEEIKEEKKSSATKNEK
jgi:hypothetical protein